jgi:hypothetical protein
MNVRAKFQVTSVTHTCAWGGGAHETDAVVLSAGQGERNKSWSKWTPSGKLEMQINNSAALNQFKIGSFVYLDFTEAPETDEKEPA